MTTKPDGTLATLVDSSHRTRSIRHHITRMELLTQFASSIHRDIGCAIVRKQRTAMLARVMGMAIRRHYLPQTSASDMV